MSIGERIRPHGEVEMDTSLGGLSQPPFLLKLVLLTALSTEGRDEKLQGRQGLALLGLVTQHLHHRGRHPAPLNACGQISSLVELRKKKKKRLKRAVNKPEGRQWTVDITSSIWFKRDFSESKATAIKSPHFKGNSKEMSPSSLGFYP